MMNELLQIEPSNFKALYLRGKAYYHLNDILKAYQDYMRALELEPDNSTIASYVSQLQ